MWAYRHPCHTKMPQTEDFYIYSLGQLYVYGLLCSGERHAIYIQRVAVGDDVGRVAVDFGYIAVAGQRPSAGGIQGDGNGADLG